MYFITACNCNILGRTRSDCDQMHGHCLCKARISGNKCDRCPDGNHIGDFGCHGGNHWWYILLERQSVQNLGSTQ